MRNEYKILNHNTTIIYIKNKGQLLECLIETKSLEKLKSMDVTWYASYAKNTKSFYARSSPYIGCQKNTKLLIHRFIMDCQNGLEVDHINHNTLDNRLSNLRIVTTAQNMQNKRLYSNSLSGATGVCWMKDRSKWAASFQVDKKRIHLGCFIDKEEAIKAVENAKRELMPFYEGRLHSEEH